MVLCRPSRLPSVEAKPFGILPRGRGEFDGPESALSIVFDWVLVLVTKWGMALLLERVGLVCLVDIFLTHWRQRILNSYFLCRYFLSVN